MSSSSLFATFIELIKHDQQINTLETEVEKLQDEIDKHEEEIAVLTENLTAVQRHAHDLHKRVEEKELHMKELDMQERDAKTRLDFAKNNREFESFQKEVTSLQQKQHEFEQELLRAWNDFEAAQKLSQERQAYAKQHIEKLQAFIYENMQKVEALQTSIDQLYQERPGKLHNLPEDMLEKYATMRTRATNPVVPITQGSCSACFYNVSQQELINIRQGALLQCKMCRRFLYE